MKCIIAQQVPVFQGCKKEQSSSKYNYQNLKRKRIWHLFSVNVFKQTKKSTTKTPESQQNKINIYLKCLTSKQTLNNTTYFKFYCATGW